MEQTSKQTSNSETVVQSTLVTLPVEVLVCICSFLGTSDLVRIRCVSKSLRCVTEIPSLWETFIWSGYAPRDDKLLKHVLKVFEKHIKRVYFADHIAPSKLQLMLWSCKNVVQLSLPSFRYVANFEKFESIISRLAGSLQSLEIPSASRLCDYRRVVKLSSNLQELSLHYRGSMWWFCRYSVQEWLDEWANLKYVPRKLSIIINDKPAMMSILLSSLQLCLPVLRNKKLPKLVGLSDIAWFNICFKTSRHFSPVVPHIQVRITDSSVAVPSVKASKYGLLGLDMDTLHLTRGSHHGKKVYKALLIDGIDEHIDTSVTSLTSITYFDASYCKCLYPGHLEQLSVACPNLQKLDLYGNSKCLSNLNGLHSLASHCKSLQGLNLMGIHVDDYEYDFVQLWEILCTMHLTQLAIEAWMIKVRDGRNAGVPSRSSADSSIAVKHQKLIDMFQKYSSLICLQVLEVEVEEDSVGSWNNLNDSELSLVSHFPSVMSYRLCNLPNSNCYHTLKNVFACKYLRSLFLSKSIPGILSLSLEGHCSCLQQLYIYSKDTVPTAAFIDALCGHGGLEHVIFCVKSLTARSVINIIEHSFNLVTFDVTLCSRAFVKAELKQLIANMKNKFPKRKLFNGGNFNIRQIAYHSISSEDANDNSLLCNTDLLSVWNSNEL